MRQRILAWAAAAAIVLLVSAAFLRPETPVFGYADTTYTGRYLLEPVGGDVEYFDTVTLRLTAWLGALEITADEDAPTFSIGSSEWRRSRRNTSVAALNMPQGYVEVEENGERVRISEIPYPHASSNLVAHALGELPFVELCTLNNPYNPDLTTVNYTFSADVADEGDSYITLYFRECSVEPIPVDPAGWRTYPRGECLYTTDEELRSATFKLSLPEASRSVYDVVAVSTYKLALKSGDMHSFNLYLRANRGDLPYLDIGSLKIERETDDGLVELLDDDGGSALGYDAPYGMEDVRFLPPNVDIGAFRFDSGRVAYYEPLGFRTAGAGVYVATLEFAENADGSGERYTLCLRIEI